MATSFAALKKSRSSSLSKLVTETAKINAPRGFKRRQSFLDFPLLIKLEMATQLFRSYQNQRKTSKSPGSCVLTRLSRAAGKWYIENSLTTFNEKDPVSEYNSTLWNNGTEAGKEQARKQKRRLSYIANIYVVKEPCKPRKRRNSSTL